MALIRKHLNLADARLKMDGDTGKFSGYASVFGGVDSYGDTILQGAFASTLRNDGKPMMFFDHAWAFSGGAAAMPIGKWVKASEDDHGLYSRTVDFLEYAPAPKVAAVSTPAGSKYTTGRGDPNAAPGTQPDPAIVALQKQAAALAKQAQGTA